MFNIGDNVTFKERTTDKVVEILQLTDEQKSRFGDYSVYFQGEVVSLVLPTVVENGPFNHETLRYLVLFTAHASDEEAYDEIGEELESWGYLYVAQPAQLVSFDDGDEDDDLE